MSYEHSHQIFEKKNLESCECEIRAPDQCLYFYDGHVIRDANEDHFRNFLC